MRRVLIAALATVAAVLGFATPAQAASWFDLSPGTSTYYITNGSVNVAKVVVGVEGFGTGTLGSVTQVRAGCSIRNLNTTYNGGVRVDDCALGIYGGQTLTGCNGSCPALDSGGCCANAWSNPRTVASGGVTAFRARITFSWRDNTSGELVGPGNLLSQGTSSAFRLL